MANMRMTKDAGKNRTFIGKRPPHFAPVGQSTQMIIGADGSNDATVLGQSTQLYSSYKQKACITLRSRPFPTVLPSCR